GGAGGGAGRGGLAEAAQSYAAAATALDQAAAAALREMARRGALQARQRASAARDAAAAANGPRWAGSLHEEAERAWAAAEDALGLGAFGEAAEGFTTAGTCFGRATEEAISARQRAEDEARRRAEE